MEHSRYSADQLSRHLSDPIVADLLLTRVEYSIRFPAPPHSSREIPLDPTCEM